MTTAINKNQGHDVRLDTPASQSAPAAYANRWRLSGLGSVFGMLSMALDCCDTLADVRQAFAMQPIARFIPWVLPLRRLNAGVEESVATGLTRVTIPCRQSESLDNESPTPGELSGHVFPAGCAGDSAKA